MLDHSHCTALQMQFGGGMDHEYDDKMDESWGHASQHDPWGSLNMRSNLSSAPHLCASPHAVRQPPLCGQLLS